MKSPNNAKAVYRFAPAQQLLRRLFAPIEQRRGESEQLPQPGHQQHAGTYSNKCDDEELTNKAMFLCQHLITNNQFRYKVEPNTIEELIEQDFIALNALITEF